MSEPGQELRENNEKIVQCIIELKTQREEINDIINKQQEEKARLQTEVERISYKLTLISKSLVQRIKTRADYDRTIEEVEERYGAIVKSSGELLEDVKKNAYELEQIMDKKIGTERNNYDEISEVIETNEMIKQNVQITEPEIVKQTIIITNDSVVGDTQSIKSTKSAKSTGSSYSSSIAAAARQYMVVNHEPSTGTD